MHAWNIYINSLDLCVKAYTSLEKTAQDTGKKHGQEGKETQN